MVIDISILISIVSAFIAALSALYAGRQAQAASRANKIALHENCFSIYKGLVRFRTHIGAKGTGIKEDDVWQFSEIAELSEFYFPSAIHSQLNTISKQAMDLISLNHEWETLREYDPEGAKVLANNRDKLMRTTRDKCFKISDEIKIHLRIGET